MSQHMALMWTVRPGSQEAVEEAFRNYGRPDHDVRDRDGNVVGRLLATQVFMKDNTVVRVIEVDGDLGAVARHMGQQPAIRKLEAELDRYLEEPRDMSTPQGARAFFQRTSMRCVVARRHDDP